MEHADHVALIRDGVKQAAGVWADLGSGSGAFTLALADLLGPDATIYSLDRDGRALRQQERALHAWFPETILHVITGDYTRPLPPELANLDGVLMANALHFQRERERRAVLAQVREALRPGGRLIVVEYNTDRGNHWVPHPFSFSTWQRLAREGGFTETRLLATRPSRFLGEIYAAASIVPAQKTPNAQASAAGNSSCHIR